MLLIKVANSMIGIGWYLYRYQSIHIIYLVVDGLKKFNFFLWLSPFIFLAINMRGAEKIIFLCCAIYENFHLSSIVKISRISSIFKASAIRSMYSILIRCRFPLDSSLSLAMSISAHLESSRKEILYLFTSSWIWITNTFSLYTKITSLLMLI